MSSRREKKRQPSLFYLGDGSELSAEMIRDVVESFKKYFAHPAPKFFILPSELANEVMHWSWDDNPTIDVKTLPEATAMFLKPYTDYVSFSDLTIDDTIDDTIETEEES
jgi:hypothetical protein